MRKTTIASPTYAGRASETEPAKASLEPLITDGIPASCSAGA